MVSNIDPLILYSHCEMITIVKLINTPITSQRVFVFLVSVC